MTNRLPIPGSDDGTWGDILNTFLEVSHNSDGSLTTAAIEQAGGYIKPSTGIPITDLDTTTQSKIDNLSSSVTTSGAGTYTKPSTGIPTTDLSSSVQANLNSASTAVQSVNSKTGTSITLAASDVGALTQATANGIYLSLTSGAPSNAGTSGQQAIDPSTGIIYTYSSGSWSQTSQVVPSSSLVTAASIRSTTGTPTSLVTDVAGDFAIDLTNGYIYGPFSGNGTSGTWPSGVAFAQGASSSVPKITTSNIFTASGTISVPSQYSIARITVKGGGGGGGGGGAAALTGGVSGQVGGGGGGAGEARIYSAVTVTPSTTLTVTIGAGGAGSNGGAASSGSTGNAGAAPTTANNGNSTTVTGTGVSCTARGGSYGGSGGANSTSTVGGGVYAVVSTAYASQANSPGFGGTAQTTAGFGSSGAVGTSSLGGGAGAPGNIGGNGFGGSGGTGAYITSNTGTTAGGNGATITPGSGYYGAGGNGGGGGAPGGAGGNGSAGVGGMALIEWIG